VKYLLTIKSCIEPTSQIHTLKPRTARLNKSRGSTKRITNTSLLAPNHQKYVALSNPYKAKKKLPMANMNINTKIFMDTPAKEIGIRKKKITLVKKMTMGAILEKDEVN